jgi:hypothetical protein
MRKQRPSDTFSLVGNLVRITKGGDRPRLAFYTAQHIMDSRGYLRIERVSYLGSRFATKDEHNIIANYRPSISVVPGKRQALASFRSIGIRDRYTRPHAIRPGPQHTGPPRAPLQKAKFVIRYEDKGTIQTRRVLYRFYDRRSIQRFQRLEQNGRLPIPKGEGDALDYGLPTRDYRIVEFKSRQRGHGSP